MGTGPTSLISKMVDLSRGAVVLIYGRSATGKTLLATFEAAVHAAAMNTKVTHIYTEPNYNWSLDVVDRIYRKHGVEVDLIEEPDHTRVIRRLSVIDKEKGLESRVIVLDSISALIDAASIVSQEQNARVVNAQMSLIVRQITYLLSRIAGKYKGVSLVTAHAASTAGTGEHRGMTVMYAPFLRRAEHYIHYQFLLADASNIDEKKIDNLEKEYKGLKPSDVRMLMGVVTRNNKEGSKIYFRFNSDLGAPIPEILDEEMKS